MRLKEPVLPVTNANIREKAETDSSVEPSRATTVTDTVWRDSWRVYEKITGCH